MNIDDNYAGRESFECSHRCSSMVKFGDDLVCNLDYKKSVPLVK